MRVPIYWTPLAGDQPKVPVGRLIEPEEAVERLARHHYDIRSLAALWAAVHVMREQNAWLAFDLRHEGPRGTCSEVENWRVTSRERLAAGFQVLSVLGFARRDGAGYRISDAGAEFFTTS